MFLKTGAPGEAKVHDVENHGVEKLLTLRAGDVFLRATVPAQTFVALEDSVRFSWNPKKVVLFDLPYQVPEEADALGVPLVGRLEIA